MSSFYNTNQTGLIPYLDPRDRSRKRIQWSLKVLLMVLLASGPVCWWISQLDWQRVGWMGVAQLALIVGTSVLPCVVASWILLLLEWQPLVIIALISSIGAVLLTIYAGMELNSLIEQHRFYRKSGKAWPGSPMDLALAVSLVAASVSALTGIGLGILIGTAREN